VLTAADAWLALPDGAADDPDGRDALALAAAGDASMLGLAFEPPDISDPNELNALDLAAGSPLPADSTWIHALLALLGGAFAAASTARFLFV
jgi:hypothetical protein